MALDTTVGGASSDSFVTLAAYQAYGAKRGWTLGASDAADEINLTFAKDVLEREYLFAGFKTTETQNLSWPRQTSIYIDGYSLDTDIVPQDIKDAQSEMAFLIQNGATPFATVAVGAVASKKVKAGAVETETTYAAGSREVPRYVAVEGLLAPYLMASKGMIGLARG
jgi:hypothetical protein